MLSEETNVRRKGGGVRVPTTLAALVCIHQVCTKAAYTTGQEGGTQHPGACALDDKAGCVAGPYRSLHGSE